MTLLRQPDATTCGSAVLVRARMLADPGYDRWVREEPERRFADEALRAHRRTNRVGGRSVPWPRALGTQPWALAAELPQRARVSLVVNRDRAWSRLVRATSPSPLYVGNRLLPRHVVLVIGAGVEQARVFEPASGATVTVDRHAFLAGRLGLAGWDRPWFLVAG